MNIFKKNKERLWDKYYPDKQNNITVPNLSIYEYLYKCSANIVFIISTIFI